MKYNVTGNISDQIQWLKTVQTFPTVKSVFKLFRLVSCDIHEFASSRAVSSLHNQYKTAESIGVQLAPEVLLQCSCIEDHFPRAELNLVHVDRHIDLNWEWDQL